MSAMRDPDQRRLLGQFVRAHRERLHADAPGGRRRTPGLRREELAARAGISLSWCTFIEQGRDVQVSQHVLARLAQSLSLTRAERAYLFELAGRRDPDVPDTGDRIDAPSSLVDAVRAMGTPAYGLDPLWNACCWNSAAQRLFTGWLDEDHDRNLLRFVFIEEASRCLIPDWTHRAHRLLSEFRVDFSRRVADPRMRDLVDELHRKSTVFSTSWAVQDVLEREGGLRQFAHPTDGLLAFRQHTFIPAERSDYKLIFLSPEKDE
jgi:transcriptional regulator with XRE-family HTH domain